MSSFGSTGLGSLAQAARKNQLKSARGILLVVGVLTVIANLVFVVIAESQVKEEINKELQQVQRQGMVIDQIKLAELEAKAVMLTRLINGGAAVLGVVFIVFALILDKYPVPITVASLVLYVGAAAVFALLNPASIVQGIVFKVIIIVALAKSIQSAIAYEKERSAGNVTEGPASPMTVQNPWDVQ
jgi:hypothetical protein